MLDDRYCWRSWCLEIRQCLETYKAISSVNLILEADKYYFYFFIKCGLRNNLNFRILLQNTNNCDYITRILENGEGGGSNTEARKA